MILAFQRKRAIQVYLKLISQEGGLYHFPTLVVWILINAVSTSMVHQCCLCTGSSYALAFKKSEREMRQGGVKGSGYHLSHDMESPVDPTACL